MNDSGNIVVQDQAIAQILTAARGAAAPLLLERYRIAGQNQDAFVAALIMRLCVAEMHLRLKPSAGGGE
ncbi:hypothetical protein IB259_11280 [Achromobacter sp. ACM04]|uniref:hypothetical protein n=1 Tax=Achromobacter sp. ACM04 TaxID=2769312 RepID=UPI00177ECE10|nr:hypothetical protein [Achromobacter sp. ACM04]MBD9419837.1 hypothetical protein [Achromobacter sp. ACM04]